MFLPFLFFAIFLKFFCSSKFFLKNKNKGLFEKERKVRGEERKRDRVRKWVEGGNNFEIEKECEGNEGRNEK